MLRDLDDVTTASLMRIADELGKKQGAEFERGYMKAMVEAHQDLAAKLESRLDVQSHDLAGL